MMVLDANFQSRRTHRNRQSSRGKVKRVHAAGDDLSWWSLVYEKKKKKKRKRKKEKKKKKEKRKKKFRRRVLLVGTTGTGSDWPGVDRDKKPNFPY